MRKRQVITEQPQEKVLLTMEEAAQALSLGLSSVYKLVRQKELASITVGRQRRVPFVELHAFVSRRLAS